MICQLYAIMHGSESPHVQFIVSRCWWLWSRHNLYPPACASRICVNINKATVVELGAVKVRHGYSGKVQATSGNYTAPPPPLLPHSQFVASVLLLGVWCSVRAPELENIGCQQEGTHECREQGWTICCRPMGRNILSSGGGLWSFLAGNFFPNHKIWKPAKRGKDLHLLFLNKKNNMTTVSNCFMITTLSYGGF